ncbi:MAG: hypothetical protein L0Y71_11900 [Gemmataceae bacterium]|nr:hypothetical protein [Gemmataceae bacterium]
MNDNNTIVLGENEVFIRLEGGEEWCAVTEAFNRHYPDRAGLPITLANYSQAEIDAVMVEFEPKKKPAGASVSPTHSD